MSLYDESFVCGIWDLLNGTNFRYGTCSCRGLNTVWRHFQQVHLCDWFTIAHVFLCLSINVEGLCYYVLKTTCHGLFYFWLFILMFYFSLWRPVDFSQFKCSSFYESSNPLLFFNICVWFIMFIFVCYYVDFSNF